MKKLKKKDYNLKYNGHNKRHRSQADLKHLKFEMKEGEYVATLIDQFEHEIIKGYGKSIVDAINDMHSNLI